jgi:two-component system alkaline phosphatase synthesis response regulator PhoP
MKKILVIEDEPNILELVLYNIRSNGFEGMGAEDGIIGLELIQREKPDLILLDLMLPGKNGMEICRELRESGDRTPIIMLTAKTDESDRVLGLEWGADDYISKPFGIRELMARIKAVLRRYEEQDKEYFKPTKPMMEIESAESVIRINGLVVDEERFQVKVDGTPVILTAKEFELLSFLARNQGLVFTRDQLLDKVWGIEYAGETRTVDVHIRYLRKKLEDASIKKGEERYIETIRGKGYRFK